MCEGIEFEGIDFEGIDFEFEEILFEFEGILVFGVAICNYNICCNILFKYFIK
jgi:hypothetical protein